MVFRFVLVVALTLCVVGPGMSVHAEARGNSAQAEEIEKYIDSYTKTPACKEVMMMGFRNIEDHDATIRLSDICLETPQAPLITSSIRSARGVALYHKGEFDRAITDLTYAIDKSKVDSVVVYGRMFRAASYNEVAQYDKAVDDITKYLEYISEDPFGYTIRARAYFNMGSYESALEDTNRAFKYGNRGPDMYDFRGVLKERLGDNEGAMADYTEAIEMAPNFSWPYRHRAALAQKMGNMKLANRDRDKLRQLR